MSKRELAKLSETDPKFYKLLQESNDISLDFSSSDDDNDGSDIDEYDSKNGLHVDSEESDYEDSTSKRDENRVTMAMVKKWRENLINNPSVLSISNAIEAFHAALARVSGEDDADLKVEGSGVFNGIVEMCVLHLHKSINDLLKLNPSNIKHPEKAKKWVKIKNLIEGYFNDLLQLLTGVASENIVCVLLKHLHSFCYFLVYFQRLSKVAVKQLTHLWCTGEETVRVLAYLCILRLCTIKKSTLLNTALKLLYVAYIRGSKFVSVNSLPQINFMKKSLVTLFTLDPIMSYNHAFLYIRQLAIHLRNAVTLQKKESYQSVYNWQYIHSLKLWADLMCETNSSELLQLQYPLIQVIIGTIKLIPTSQYIPLRFHCLQMLIKLVKDTDTFIPVLPFIIDGLSCIDINKRCKNVSMKPYDLTFVLRLSKAAMTETGFLDAVVDNVYQLTIEYSAAYGNRLAFPDLFIPVISQLKNIIKKCKNPKYTNKLKQMLIKIEENSKFIANERSKLAINLNEIEKIKAFESEMILKNPPIIKFRDQLQKVSEMKRARESKEVKEEKKPKEELPVKSKSKRKKEKREESEDDSEFEFPDISDSDEPQKKKKKTVKNNKEMLEIDSSSDDEDEPIFEDQSDSDDEDVPELVEYHSGSGDEDENQSETNSGDENECEDELEDLNIDSF